MLSLYIAHACGACLLGALHCLHMVFSGVLHFGTALRKWVTHLPRDLRPRHFLFAPRLQTVHPEVEVKQESFREPFCYVSVFVHWLLCAWSVSGRIISLRVFDTGEYHQPASVPVPQTSPCRCWQLRAGESGDPIAGPSCCLKN